ncbi:hypothetical protein Tco_1345886 [Tanacetum coccineum]
MKIGGEPWRISMKTDSHPNVTIPLLPDFGGVTDGTRAKNPSSLSDIHCEPKIKWDMRSCWYLLFFLASMIHRIEEKRQVVRLASIGTGVGQCSPANQVVEGLEALLLALLWEDLRPDIVCLTLNELELVHNAL